VPITNTATVVLSKTRLKEQLVRQFKDVVTKF